MNDPKGIIRQFVADNFLFGQDDDLSDESSFLDEGIVDSLGVLEIVAFLQERFAIQVEAFELTPENLDTINAIAMFVSGKQSHV